MRAGSLASWSSLQGALQLAHQAATGLDLTAGSAIDEAAGTPAYGESESHRCRIEGGESAPSVENEERGKADPGQVLASERRALSKLW